MPLLCIEPHSRRFVVHQVDDCMTVAAGAAVPVVESAPRRYVGACGETSLAELAIVASFRQHLRAVVQGSTAGFGRKCMNFWCLRTSASHDSPDPANKESGTPFLNQSVMALHFVNPIDPETVKLMYTRSRTGGRTLAEARQQHAGSAAAERRIHRGQGCDGHTAALKQGVHSRSPVRMPQLSCSLLVNFDSNMRPE